VKGKVLTFAVSGSLWNRNLVMYDDETKSFWSQIQGEAKQGELKGATLEILPSEIVTWEEWRRQHPNTTVLNLSRSAFVQRGVDLSAGFLKNAADFVFGWSVGQQRYHTSLETLMKQPVMNVTVPRGSLLVTYDPETTEVSIFTRDVDNRTLSFVAVDRSQMRDEQTGSIWDPRTGEAVNGNLKGKRLQPYLGTLAYAVAWEGFFPNSKKVPLE
jgi:hypothetical protein